MPVFASIHNDTTVCVCPSGAVRASSIFPIMSVGLLFMGGLCVAASEFYRSRHNVILSAGIFFVSAGRRDLTFCIYTTLAYFCLFECFSTIVECSVRFHTQLLV